MTAVTLPHPGLNRSNRVLVKCVLAVAVVDGADASLQMPADMIGKAMAPFSIRVFAYGAGAEGARTLTLSNEDDGAGTGVTAKTYVETTGVLLITNNMAADLAIGTVLLVEMVSLSTY